MTARARFAAASGVALAAWTLFVCVIVLRPLGDFGTMAFDDLFEAVVPAVAAMLCLRAGAREQGRTRRAWRLLSAGLLSWTLGELVWSWYELVERREVPFPSLADLGYLGMVPLIALALLTFPAAPSRTASRLRLALDGLIVATATLLISWATFLGPVYRATEGSVAERAIGLAYPVGDVVLVTLLVFAAVRGRGEGRGAFVLIGAGIAAISAADAMFAYFTASGTYETGDLIGLGWVVGFSLLGLAPLLPSPRVARQEPVAPLDVRGALLPYAAGILGIGVAAVRAVAGAVDRVVIASGGALIGFVLIRQMLTLLDRVALEHELARQAFHDPLTGLANRALFRDRVTHAIERRLREGNDFAVAFVDLDDFKTINDSLGHDAGDRLLVQVAERVRGCMRAGDTAARLGGDEFALLLERVRDPGEAAGTSERVIEALRPPFDLDGREIYVGASVGVVTTSSGDETAEDLLRSADVAMYAAKAHGKGRVSVFEPSMHAMVLDRAGLQADLRHALDRGELMLRYQPVVELATGHVAGVEALLRWRHPVRGELHPREFIGVAEDTGLIVPIGRWVLEQAACVAASWTMRRPPAWIAVNASARELRHPAFARTVISAVGAYGLQPSSLMIELCEDDLMASGGPELGSLRDLRRAGVHVAMDDFGSGRSSLSHLQYLPVDTLKMDRAFVAMLGRGPKDTGLVDLVLRLAGTLGLRTIAQGIETPQQAAALRDLGAELGQGYLLSEPVDEDGLARLVTEANRGGLRSA